MVVSVVDLHLSVTDPLLAGTVTTPCSAGEVLHP